MDGLCRLARFFQERMADSSVTGLSGSRESASVEEPDLVREYESEGRYGIGIRTDLVRNKLLFTEEEDMTSKQRAFLKSLASKEDTIVQIGKEALTPENTAAIEEALAARELVKVGVGQNCLDDITTMAVTAAERTRAQLVQVIGRKFILYREGRDDRKKIELPPERGSGHKSGR